MASKKTLAGAESVSFLLVLAGILVALNVLGVFWFVRADATESKVYSLADSSKKLAGGLKDRLEIVAYFSADLPPPFNATERYVRDILQEYSVASKGNIKLRFVNPDDEDEKEEAEKEGVQKVRHSKADSTGASVVEGYRGLAFHYLGKTKAIPVIGDTEGLEYNITQLIKEMTGDKRKLGVLSGQEGPSLEKGLQNLAQALPTYELVGVDAESPISADIKALLVVAPENEISEAKLRSINTYLMNGGALAIFGGSTKLNLGSEQEPPGVSGVDSGVNRLLNAWGINMEKNLVADPQSLRINMFIPYMQSPVVAFDEEQQKHPAAFRLTHALLPWVSQLKIDNNKNLGKDVKRTVLARSSENAWVLTGDTISIDPDPRNLARPDGAERSTLVIALEGKLPSAFAPGADGQSSDASDAPAQATKSVRVFVSGTASFLRDEALQIPIFRRDLPSTRALALNAIDWLTQDADLIAIRAKTIEDPPLKTDADITQAQQEEEAAGQDAAIKSLTGDQAGAEEATKRQEAAAKVRKAKFEQWQTKQNWHKWLNILGMPSLFIVFGLIRWQLRKAKRASLKL